LDQIIFSQRAELVKAALERIPPEQRRVLETAYFEGKTQTEIAASMDLPLGTVKSRVRDGMKALQGLLRDRL
jgi:RNA polymerase sigma-70 factor, ECF subfamily